MFEARDMQHKTIVLWLAGLLAVLAVAWAGAWSLTVATAYAYADEAPNTELTQPAAKAPATDATAPAAKAPATDAAASAAKAPDAATDGAKTQPADEAPGVYQLPLRAKASRAADPAVITPATFTIAGKKFLDGRALEAGEFTFHIAKLGAYTVPLGSKLPSQLRSTALSDEEKYEMVAYGGLHYLNSAVQPLPDPDTATNAADGTVSFAPITIDASMLGETATRRTTGVIFAYSFSEEPPRNADGTLAAGVTKDSLGRYVYQGVTYDDTLKRAYLYAYQDYDADKNPVVKVIALGDATFDAAPVRDQAGLGVGFRNTYNGAVVENYYGTVHLEGRSISAGEFNFDVHEVSEDGALVGNEMVPCEKCDGGGSGAEVPVLNGRQLNEAGRYYFTVSQTAAGPTAPADVELDKTAYVVAVDVEADAQDKLSANVTAVRKMEAGTDEWVDVSTAPDGSATPLVWENKLAADEPAAPGDADKPDAGQTPGAGVTVPGNGEAAGEIAGAAPDDADEGTGAPDAAAPDHNAPAGDAADAAADAADKPAADAAEATRPEGAQDGDHSAEAAGEGSDSADDATADKAAPVPDKTQATQGQAPSKDDNPVTLFLAQTDDPAPWMLAALAALILGSAGVLAVAYRRRG